MKKIWQALIGQRGVYYFISGLFLLAFAITLYYSAMKPHAEWWLLSFLAVVTLGEILFLVDFLHTFLESLLRLLQLLWFSLIIYGYTVADQVYKDHHPAVSYIAVFLAVIMLYKIWTRNHDTGN